MSAGLSAGPFSTHVMCAVPAASRRTRGSFADSARGISGRVGAGTGLVLTFLRFGLYPGVTYPALFFFRLRVRVRGPCHGALAISSESGVVAGAVALGVAGTGAGVRVRATSNIGTSARRATRMAE
jgi:hypothetical protein